MPNNNIEKLVDIMKNGRNCNLMMGHIMGSDIRYFASELVKNDVVPVIRCKDCIFSHPVIGTAYLKFCKKFDYEMWHEGFCYYGEKIGD